MSNRVSVTVAVILLTFTSAIDAHTADRQPLTVVENLDIQRYAGRWFEIARLPNRFQDHCIGDVTAEYAPQPGETIAVTNRCKKSDGSWDDAKGVARQPEGAPSSVFKVRFAPAILSLLPMVWGDYQVMALDDAHTYSLVGTPDRKYLWILARSSTLETATYEELTNIAGGQGFDVSKLVRTRHGR